MSGSTMTRKKTPFLERVGANNNNRVSRKKPHIEFEREPVGINLLKSIENIPTGALTEPMHNLSPEDNEGIRLYNSLYKHVWHITSKYILDSSHKNKKDFLLRDIGAELDSIISVNTISSYYRRNFTNAIDELIKSPTYIYAKNTTNRIGITSIILDYILGVTGPMRELFTAYEVLRTRNKEMNETRKKQLLMIATVQDIWLTHREIIKENAHGRTNAAERKRRRSRRNRTNRINTRRRR